MLSYLVLFRSDESFLSFFADGEYSIDRKTAQKFECQCAGRTDELLRCEQSIAAGSIIVPSLLIARQLQHRVQRGHRSIASTLQLNYTKSERWKTSIASSLRFYVQINQENVDQRRILQSAGRHSRST